MQDHLNACPAGTSLSKAFRKVSTNPERQGVHHIDELQEDRVRPVEFEDDGTGGGRLDAAQIVAYFDVRACE